MGGGKSKSSTSSTTNITTTTENNTAIADENSVAVVSDSFVGDIGLTGQNALDVTQEFTEFQRDQELLFAQREANLLRVFSSNTGSSPRPILGFTDETEKDGETESKKFDPRNVIIIVGGLAAVATLLKLRN